ncbi:MAG: MerR family transcriptional regulator [Actinomycetota bacterium]
MSDEQGYRVPEVCRIVGITYRQLDYWARTGLVNPSVQEAGGSGTQRLYSFEDLVQLRVIKRLLDAGISLQSIRQAIGYLRDRLKQAPHGMTLMSDGKSIYALESADEIIDLLQRGQGVFGIAIDKVWTDVEGSLKEAGRAVAKAGGA